MKDEIAQAFLMEVLQSSEAEMLDDNRRFFQNMARYKYDQYQQFAPGMRFIERFALWLNQFDPTDKKALFEFIRKRLVFISNEEINLLVSACYPDLIKQILVKKVSSKIQIPEYSVTKITTSKEFNTILKQSLFFGLSDGARTDVFRRANSGIISHEQIYQTYELSEERAKKMQDDFLHEELIKMHGTDYDSSLKKFRQVFLLDDFSASGTSYLTEREGKLKGKISQLYKNIFEASEKSLQQIFEIKELDIHVILYLCTNQAYEQICSYFDKLQTQYHNRPSLHVMHLIPDSFKLNEQNEKSIYDICMNPKYYDAGVIEDKHTGNNIQLGYMSCALPLVLAHNCPNNSLSMLWSYEHSEKFEGLFPRIPRHRVL
jgi:hypothetical protein